MDNNDTEMTAGAEHASGKKFKMSEIIAAMKNHDVEMDVKGVLAYCDEEASGSLCDLDRTNMKKTLDVSIALVHLGLSKLMADALNNEPDALGIFAKYHAREQRKNDRSNGLMGLMDMLAGNDND